MTVKWLLARSHFIELTQGMLMPTLVHVKQGILRNDEVMKDLVGGLVDGKGIVTLALVEGSDKNGKEKELSQIVGEATVLWDHHDEGGYMSNLQEDNPHAKEQLVGSEVKQLFKKFLRVGGSRLATSWPHDHTTCTIEKAWSVEEEDEDEDGVEQRMRMMRMDGSSDDEEKDSDDEEKDSSDSDEDATYQPAKKRGREAAQKAAQIGSSASSDDYDSSSDGDSTFVTTDEQIKRVKKQRKNAKAAKEKANAKTKEKAKATKAKAQANAAAKKTAKTNANGDGGLRSTLGSTLHRSAVFGSDDDEDELVDEAMGGGFAAAEAGEETADDGLGYEKSRTYLVPKTIGALKRWDVSMMKHHCRSRKGAPTLIEVIMMTVAADCPFHKGINQQGAAWNRLATRIEDNVLVRERWTGKTTVECEHGDSKGKSKGKGNATPKAKPKPKTKRVTGKVRGLPVYLQCPFSV